MTIKIIKIDGEFAIVELENGECKICPSAIFGEGVKIGDIFSVIKK